jgi:hypothetical protein
MPDTTYFPLVVGVISFVASVSAAVLAGIFVRRNEQAKWLRQERLGAYSSFLGRMASLTTQSANWVGSYWEVSEKQRHEATVTLTEFLSSGYAISLLGSSSLVREADMIADHLLAEIALSSREERDAAEDQLDKKLPVFIELARMELGLK